MASEEAPEAVRTDLEDCDTVTPPVFVSAVDLETQTGLNSPPLKRARLSESEEESEREIANGDEIEGEEYDEWEDEDELGEEPGSPDSFIWHLFHAEGTGDNDRDGTFLLEAVS